MAAALGYNKSSVIDLTQRSGGSPIPRSIKLIFSDTSGAAREMEAALRTQLPFSLLDDKFAAKLGLNLEESNVGEVEEPLKMFQIKGVDRKVQFRLSENDYETEFYAVDGYPGYSVVIGSDDISAMGLLSLGPMLTTPAGREVAGQEAERSDRTHAGWMFRLPWPFGLSLVSLIDGLWW